MLRQDAPGEPSYWERHSVEHEADMNVTSVLQRIAARPRRSTASAWRPWPTTPIAWKKSAAVCTMIINGRVRQACSALVDKLLAEQPEEIELQPMSKFPVIRDLCVNRRRLFRALEKAAGLDSGRRLLRHGPRPAAVAGATGTGLSAEPSA